MKHLQYLLIIVFTLILFSCKKGTLFQQISSSHSNIHFNNKIVETDSINPLTMINIYNGGGVGIGDFNNDGKPDIYFSGNAVSNKLYLNKGNFKFQDITQQAGVGGKGGWGRGVAVVDINNDGLPDIYVCNTLLKDSVKRTNLLYINQGCDKNGIPHFKEMAHEYGLDMKVHSTMAVFFDYDNDGDLDMYLTVNELNPGDNPTTYRPIITNGTYHSTGRLYRNDWNPKLKHGVYTDVSKQAGIQIEGYGHAASIVDINRDGWKDIYVTNDFITNDILYINNHDGTFTDQSQQYFKHTSLTAMGQDFEDINNDGQVDLFALDMNPADNYRKKMFMPPNSYQNYLNTDYYHYQYQYPHNTLQLNMGPRVGPNDSVGAPVFSEIGYLANVAQTDWSWCPLVTDFDNDGYRDIVVTNGYPKDVTDHDFTTFRAEAYQVASMQQILSQIPVVKIPNYAFRNNGKLQFDDVTKNWGLTMPSFSNGAAYADFDGDGAMDMVISNIDDEPFIYRNTLRDGDHKEDHHFLNIKFKGTGQNRDGFGAWVDIYYDHGKHQVYENNPYRGYLSTIQNMAHFGLGTVSKVDSVVVQWPGDKKQTLTYVKADQVLTLNIANARAPWHFAAPVTDKQTLFTDVTRKVGVQYQHQDQDYIDFNVQKLLPHKLSEYNPALAVGDVDENGLDDIVVGGNSQHHAQILLQQANGHFIQKDLSAEDAKTPANFKDAGMLLFDADGDGDLDLYIASGGYENEPNSKFYQDRFYVNDGKGNFTEQADALPQNHTSKLCVKAADFDHDGDLDLFVSGRVDPWNYPKPVSSFILRNDSKNGKIKFTDVTATVAKDLQHIGMVCDATFTDFDNDGWPDLIMAGDWMPITVLKNDHGVFKNITSTTGIAGQLGWWTTIAAGDFDHDGDVDYIVGNTGLNTFYRASEKYPAYITAKDFDNNGSYDAFPSLFLPDQDGELKEFPAQTRDDIVKQMIGMRVKFQNYKSFAKATMDEVITPEMRKGAIRLKVNMQQSCYMRNDGDGKFTLMPLPIEAQFAPLCGIAVDDFDHDGNLDVMINGNDYGTDVTTGRYDAFNGLLLKGDGKGNFKPLSILQSGIYLPGNCKGLVALQGAGGKYLIAASENKGPIKVFESKADARTIKLLPDDAYALIKYKNGRKERREFCYGSSFLSQSGRFLNINNKMAAVQITNNKGSTRNIRLD